MARIEIPVLVGALAVCIAIASCAGAEAPTIQASAGEQASPAAATAAKAADMPTARAKGGPRNGSFPKTATEYAKMIEPHLGVPPKIDLGQSVEIPLYVRGERKHGNLGRSCDNYSLLGKDTVSGSVLQRHEGRTADGAPLPDVVWVSFGRNSTRDPARVLGSVQMIGYHKVTGATAFFESCDAIAPWVRLDEGTLRMRGVMPWIDDPDGFDRAYVVPDPSRPQCVQCHQADPFITNAFINAARIPGSDEGVVPVLDEDAPYYVLGGEHWDMRTIHIEGNGCMECHRVGMSTVAMFMENGWDANQHMPPRKPGSLAKDFAQLLDAWRNGPASVPGASWVLPPAQGKGRVTVGDEYPNKAAFNAPARRKPKKD